VRLLCEPWLLVLGNAEPTPDIDATDATMEARVKQEVAARPTAAPTVDLKEATSTTPEPTHTDIPEPIPANYPCTHKYIAA